MSDLFQRLTEPVTDPPTAIQPLRVSRFTLLSDGALTLPDGLKQPAHPPHAVQGVNQWAGPTLPAPLITEEAAQSLTGALPAFRRIGRMAAGDGAPSAQPLRLVDAELVHEAESGERDADLSVAEQTTNHAADLAQPAAQSAGQLDSSLATIGEARATGSPVDDAHSPYAPHAALVARKQVASSLSTHLEPNVYRTTEMTPGRGTAPINKTHLDPVKDGAPLLVPGETANVTSNRAELSTDKSAASELAASSLGQENATETPQSTKPLPENPVTASVSLAHTVHPSAARLIQDDYTASPALVGRPQSKATQVADPLATTDPMYEPENSLRVQPASVGVSKVAPALALADLGETGANTAPVGQQAPIDATVQRKAATQPDAAPLTPGVPSAEIRPITLAGQPQADALSSKLEVLAQTPPALVPRVTDELGVDRLATSGHHSQPLSTATNLPASPEQAGRAVLETSPLVQPALSAPTVVTPSVGETPSGQAENANDPLAQAPWLEKGSVARFQETDLTSQVQPRVREKNRAGEPATPQAVAVSQRSGSDSGESSSLENEQIQRKPTVTPLSPSVMPMVSTPDSSSLVAATPPAALMPTGSTGQDAALAMPVSHRQNEVTVAPLLEPERPLPQHSQHDVRLSPGETTPEPAKVSTSQTATNTLPTQAMQDLSMSLPVDQPDPAQVIGQASTLEISTSAEQSLSIVRRAEQAQVEPRLLPFTPMESNLFERANRREKGVEAVPVTTEFADETAKTPLAQPQLLLSPANAGAIQTPQTGNPELAIQPPTFGQPPQPQTNWEATILPRPLPVAPLGDESTGARTQNEAMKDELLDQSVKSRPIVEPVTAHAVGIVTENAPRAPVAPPQLDEQVNISTPAGQMVQPSSLATGANPAPAASTHTEGVVYPAVQALQALLQNEATPATASLGATQPLHSTLNQPVSPPASTVAPLLLTPAQSERMEMREKQVGQPAGAPSREGAASPASNPRQDQPAAEVAALTAQLKPVARLEQAVEQAVVAKAAQMAVSYQQQREDQGHRVHALAARQEPPIQQKVGQGRTIVAQRSAEQTEPSQPAQSNGSLTPLLRNVAVQQPTAEAIDAPLVDEFAIVQPVRSSQSASRPVVRQLGVAPAANPAGVEARTADTASVQPHFEIFAPKRKPTAPPEPQPLPTIQVTIGRLIVQTTPEQPKPAAPQRRTTQPPLSLDAYLQQRTREAL